MKDHIVEIVAIVLAVAILGWFWNQESGKPDPVVPTTQTQTQTQTQQQAQ